MVSASSGAIIEHMTTGFELTVPLEIKALQKSKNFVFSYKLTQNPNITN